MATMTLCLHELIDSNEGCTCGSDTCVCQGCGRIVCGDSAIWTGSKGNIGPCCFGKIAEPRAADFFAALDRAAASAPAYAFLREEEQIDDYHRLDSVDAGWAA